MKKMIFLFGLLFLISCNERDLGSSYYYLPEYDAKDALTGSFLYKSFNENVFDEIVIYPKVKKIAYDDDYIIVLQQPNKELMLKQIKSDLTFWNHYYIENKNDSLVNLIHGKLALKVINNLIQKNKAKGLDKISDSIFNKESFYKEMFKNKENYYIIQKENDSIFGPLNFKDFIKIKIKKSIDLDFK